MMVSQLAARLGDGRDPGMGATQTQRASAVRSCPREGTFAAPPWVLLRPQRPMGQPPQAWTRPLPEANAGKRNSMPRASHPLRQSIPVFLALILPLTFAAAGQAAQPSVGLGTAGSFGVLGGSTVTNTGPTVINGDLGVSPGTAIPGFPPGTLIGTIHAANAVAALAQSDLTTAYNDAAGRTPPSLVPGDLGGPFLTPGVYNRSSSLVLRVTPRSTPRATLTPYSSSRSARPSRPPRTAVCS